MSLNFNIPTEKMLNEWSFDTGLGINLKNSKIKLIDFNILYKSVAEYDTYLQQFSDLSDYKYRVKSESSIEFKRKKYQDRSDIKANILLNDILGIRMNLDEYPNLADYTKYLKIRDFTVKPKDPDDGYRAVHCYYQKNNTSFRIEIQIWAGSDVNFNIWSHMYSYKQQSPEIMLKLRQLYDLGIIITEEDYQRYVEELINGKH
jgi:putative GTP pyrophosphokinase